jgi:hypothetical protein
MKIFDSSKFCRLMKGRLYFYGHAPDCFDSTWPIQNEFARMNSSYLQVPFLTFAEVFLKDKLNSCADVFDKMRKNGMLIAVQHDALLRFDRLTADVPGRSEARKRSLEVADIFDDVFEALYLISSIARGEIC